MVEYLLKALVMIHHGRHTFIQQMCRGRKASVAIDGHPQGTVARPQTVGQRWIVIQNGVCAHHDGHILSSHSVHQHLCEGRRETCWRLVGHALFVHIAIGTLSPFERHPRPMVAMEIHKASVQTNTLLLQDAHTNFYPCITKFLDAQTIDLGKGVLTAHHHPRYLLPLPNVLQLPQLQLSFQFQEVLELSLNLEYLMQFE